MSESTISVLIAVGLLIVLALFVPCMESLGGILRRNAMKRKAHADVQTTASDRRDAA